MERRPGGGAPRKSRRLSRSAEFERVYREGRSRANRYLVLYGFPRGGGEGARLGVSVSRKVGGAVDRSRVKRLLREAFRARAAELPPDHDFVLVARPDARELAEREGAVGIERVVSELLAEAGFDGGGKTS